MGGRSGEHEVSLASANSVMDALDKDKYEIVPIGITQEGRWLAGVNPRPLLAGAAMDETMEGVTAVSMTGDPTKRGLVPAAAGAGNGEPPLGGPLDVVIPVLHGTFGEDGTLQGLLEMAGIPYAGCGVLGSALGMDKEKAKLVFKAADLPVVDWLTVRRLDHDRDADAVRARIEARFAYPVFVKPANMGSSVGVGKAHDRSELHHALADRAGVMTAKPWSSRASTPASSNAACWAMTSRKPQWSARSCPPTSSTTTTPSTSTTPRDFYIPAPITPENRGGPTHRHRRIPGARSGGLARVDFFLDRDAGDLYVNEVNTMPGFTQISMYPKLWEATGVPYPQLLDRLIDLALERHAEKSRTRTTYTPD